MLFGYLGPLLIQPDKAAVALASQRQRILLAALLTRAGRPVPAGELAELVWDGQPPGRAMDTLRTHVMRLRFALGTAAGSRIITRDPGYLIEASEDEVDALRFTRACRDGSAAYRAARWSAARDVLAEGLALWRGEALADVPSQLLRDAEQPALERLRIQARQWRIDCDLRLGGGEELVGEIQQLIDREPLREQLYVMLMTALARCGRASEALSVYQQARKTLVGQLGIEPGAELKDLQRQILAGEQVRTGPGAGVPPLTVATRPVPRQLPAVAGHFAGRAAELNALDSALARHGTEGGMVAISAIGGMAGIGKTTLALYWAHRVCALFPDGQLYVNLRGFDPAAPMTPADAMRGLLEALRDPGKPLPPDLDAQAALYRSLLADRRVLVVLDNARDEEQVRPLLPGSASNLTLITSRRPLTGLVTTNGATPVRLNLLGHEEARELLSARLGVETVAEEPDAIGQIIAACAGLPIALAIVAARAAVSPEHELTALAAQLSEPHLDALSSTDPHADLRSVFSWSYRQLSPDAARLFRRLPSFPGPDVTPDAVASITPAAQAGKLLGELTGACLLEEFVPGRFRLHDLLALFAEDRARQEDAEQERRETMGQILTWYSAAATAAAHKIGLRASSLRAFVKVPEPMPAGLATASDALAWLETERRNLIAALQRADQCGFDAAAATLPFVMSELFEVRAHWHDWLHANAIGIEAARRTGDLAIEAHLLNANFRAHLGLGDPENGADGLRRALAIWQSLEDTAGQVKVLRNLSIAHFEAGRLAAAVAEIEQAILLARESGHQRAEGRALCDLGWMYQRAAQPERALNCYLSASAVATAGDSFLTGTIRANLAGLYVELGRFDDAMAVATAALDLVTQTGALLTSADAHRALGDALDGKGCRTEARAHWQTALTLYQEVEDPRAKEVAARLAGG